MCNVGDNCPKGIGDSALASDLLLGILSRLAPLAFPLHRLMCCRAVNKIAVACPSSEYTEIHRIGGDQVECTGEAVGDLC